MVIYQPPLFNIAHLHGVDVHLYADDTQLYASYDWNSPEHTNAAASNIEECIGDIYLWMCEAT